MFSKTILTLNASVLLLSVSSARADFYECDGKWTNKPCSGQVTGKISEGMSASPQDPGLSAKRSMLHELTMKQISARERYGIGIDISAVEDYCLKNPSSIDQCGDSIASASEGLDRRIATAVDIEAKKKANDLQDEANQIQAERNRIEAEKPNITVVQEYYGRNRPIIVVPRDGRAHMDSGAGVSVDLSGHSGNGHFGLSANSGYSSGHTQIAPIQPIPPIADPHSHSGIVISDHSGIRKVQGVKPGPFARPD